MWMGSFILSIGFLTAISILWVVKSYQRQVHLNAIPTVGSSTWLGSWWAAYKYVIDAQSILQEGYVKHKSAPFKVAELYYWTVILSNPDTLQELVQASEDHFSVLEAIDDFIQIRYTIGPEIVQNPYHVAVIRTHLTRKLQTVYLDIRDEIIASFNEVLCLRGNEWKSIRVLHAIERIICRTNNRVFVGLPLCRNPDWINLNIRYADDVLIGGAIVGMFPTFLRATATRFLTNGPRNIALGMQILGPTIEERKRCLAEHGTGQNNKPNDLLSWLMEQADNEELTVERLANRVLFVNFTAIHTSANVFTQALFRLATEPKYIRLLREEVEGIVEKDGWSKAAVRKMHKVDSFLKECQRMEGIHAVTIVRKAVNDYTFADGTFIPKGTRIGAATLSRHYDPNIYENPHVFMPLRFVEMREEGGLGARHQFASTSTEYLPFGHSRHACPGRFFVAAELKTMMAYVIITYDLKLDGDTTYPASWYLSTLIGANSSARILFRNRVD